MNRKCARGSWNADHQCSIWFTEGYWSSHMAGSTLKLWPATRSPIQLFVDLLELFPQRINMHAESCCSWQYLCGCAQCSMFVISKAWKVAVRPTKPKCCHYRLLDGTPTLPFAQIGLHHQGKDVYHISKWSRYLEKRWKIGMLLSLGQSNQHPRAIFSQQICVYFDSYRVKKKKWIIAKSKIRETSHIIQIFSFLWKNPEDLEMLSQYLHLHRRLGLNRDLSF